MSKQNQRENTDRQTDPHPVTESRPTASPTGHAQVERATAKQLPFRWAGAKSGLETLPAWPATGVFPRARRLWGRRSDGTFRLQPRSLPPRALETPDDEDHGQTDGQPPTERLPPASPARSLVLRRGQMWEAGNAVLGVPMPAREAAAGRTAGGGLSRIARRPRKSLTRRISREACEGGLWLGRAGGAPMEEALPLAPRTVPEPPARPPSPA